MKLIKDKFSQTILFSQVTKALVRFKNKIVKKKFNKRQCLNIPFTLSWSF